MSEKPLFTLSGTPEPADVEKEFETIILSAADQRSAGWAKLRAGRFTASSIGALFTEGRDKALAAQNEGFGATAVTLVRQKAMELFLGHAIDDGLDTYDIRWGRVMERPARDFFEAMYGIETIDCTFMPHGEDAGGSADFLCEWGTAEIKNPKPLTHAGYLFEITDFESLKKVNKDYWYQINANCVFYGLDQAVFISFDPRMIPEAWPDIDMESFSGKYAFEIATDFQKKTAMHVVRGKLDPYFPEQLASTLERAVRLRNRFLEQIQERFKTEKP